MDTGKGKKILLISLSCIGDVLLTTPVMKSLKDNFPGASLDVVAGPTVTPILERHELVDRVIICENKDRHKGIKGAARLVMELRGSKYDLVVDLRNTMMPYFLRVDRRITAHGAHLKNKNASGRHAIDRHLDVLAMAGLSASTTRMIVTIPADTRAKVKAFLEEKGLGEAELFAVYPGAGSPYKLYPVDKFQAALREIKDKSEGRFIMVGSQADLSICEEVGAALGDRAVCVAGELDILELGALLERCRLMITNDSGPMHLSVAVDTPTVAIFGPTNAQRYGPRGDAHKIVWHREECNPCKYPTCEKESCIAKVPPEQVAAAALELLGEGGDR